MSKTEPSATHTETTPLLYSLSAAGQVLDLSETTVRVLIRERQLRAVQVRGRLKVHRADLEAYAESLRDTQNDFTQNGSVPRREERSR